LRCLYKRAKPVWGLNQTAGVKAIANAKTIANAKAKANANTKKLEDKAPPLPYVTAMSRCPSNPTTAKEYPQATHYQLRRLKSLSL
jgi:hypothetical protein